MGAKTRSDDKDGVESIKVTGSKIGDRGGKLSKTGCKGAEFFKTGLKEGAEGIEILAKERHIRRWR